MISKTIAQALRTKYAGIFTPEQTELVASLLSDAERCAHAEGIREAATVLTPHLRGSGLASLLQLSIRALSLVKDERKVEAADGTLRLVRP